MSNDKLTPPQETAIELLLSGNSIIRVCEELSIDRVTLYRWRQSQHFAAAYREARQAISERTRELLQMAAMRAVKRLVELMEGDSEDVPASIQFASARSILDLHFKGMELEDVQASVEELKLLIGESKTKKGLRAA
jgi:hypothetical protein